MRPFVLLLVLVAAPLPVASLARAECTEVGTIASFCESSYGAAVDSHASGAGAGASEYRYSFFGDSYTLVSAYAYTPPLGGARAGEATIGCTDRPGGSACDVLYVRIAWRDSASASDALLVRTPDGTFVCTTNAPKIADGCRKLAL